MVLMKLDDVCSRPSQCGAPELSLSEWLPGITAVGLLPCVKVDQRHGWFFSTRRQAAERLRSEEAEEGRWDVGERAAERKRERERGGG